jgi:hypothetical protein
LEYSPDHHHSNDIPTLLTQSGSNVNLPRKLGERFRAIVRIKGESSGSGSILYGLLFRQRKFVWRI